jgi:hypothetical protein
MYYHVKRNTGKQENHPGDCSCKTCKLLRSIIRYHIGLRRAYDLENKLLKASKRGGE